MNCERTAKIRVSDRPRGMRTPRLNPATRQLECIDIVQTKTGFGFRDWFACPSCGKRCGVLYALSHLACKQCHGLHHAVEHEGRFDRALRAAFKHREKFGQRAGGVVAAFPSKPKRTRWHTYFAARRKDEALRNRVFGISAEQLSAKAKREALFDAVKKEVS